MSSKQKDLNKLLVLFHDEFSHQKALNPPGGLSLWKEILAWRAGFIFLFPDILYLCFRWVLSTALWLCLWRDIWQLFIHLPCTGKTWIIRRMMADPTLMIIQNLRSFLTAFTPTAVTPTALIVLEVTWIYLNLPEFTRILPKLTWNDLNLTEYTRIFLN